MKERPILFSTEMVKAILEERKTQTRRIMKPQPIHNNGWWVWEGTRPKAKYNSGLTAANYPPNKWLHPPTSPYGIPGDRLWVRETFLVERSQHKDFYEYKADYSNTFAGDVCWKPSIFMPREASRILLEVTDVRVERLRDISEEDAIAEGIAMPNYAEEAIRDVHFPEPTEIYMMLWESINGKGSWDKNPWVWVISFKKIEP